MEKKKITAEIVATTSLPVNRLTATDCNAAARANFQFLKYILHVKIDVEVGMELFFIIVWHLKFSGSFHFDLRDSKLVDQDILDGKEKMDKKRRLFTVFTIISDKYFF